MCRVREIMWAGEKMMIINTMMIQRSGVNHSGGECGEDHEIR